MGYEPFERGPFPVGVVSGELTDEGRQDRRFGFEVWYPAAPRYGGLDLQPATQDHFSVLPGTPALSQAAVRDAQPDEGAFPLVLFSHPSQGHRRQSSFLCTHLASHGYVVAAPDHNGNTLRDLAEFAASGRSRTPGERASHIERIIADRVPDLRVLTDRLLAGMAGVVVSAVDDRHIGVMGWSFGGWAALSLLEADDRFSAVVPMAPAGNSKPLPGVIPATLTFEWRRDVAALYLAAGRDRATPVEGICELVRRTPSPCRLFILGQADHEHFGDHIEVALCPPEHARLFARSLTLAHFDGALKRDPAADAFLEKDAISLLTGMGLDVAVENGGRIAAGPS